MEKSSTVKYSNPMKFRKIWSRWVMSLLSIGSQSGKVRLKTEFPEKDGAILIPPTAQ